jgi:hypothetical protein
MPEKLQEFREQLCFQGKIKFAKGGKMCLTEAIGYFQVFGTFFGTW